MACGCKRNSAVKYVWTSEPDENGQTFSVQYNTEIEAKAKKMRTGGTYAKTG